MAITYADIRKREAENKAKLLELFPTLTEESGIYIMTREEDGIKYAYVGQAKHILTRLAQHLSGYQHIDLSIKNHGLYSNDNPYGWNVTFFNCNTTCLDAQEREWIVKMANKGYQLRNHTIGGQGVGKKGMGNSRPTRTYRDGVKQGEENARKFIARVFKHHLDYSIKGNTNSVKEKALAQFLAFINVNTEE